MAINVVTGETIADILEKSQKVLDKLRADMVSDIAKMKLAKPEHTVDDTLHIANIHATAALSLVHYVQKMYRSVGREVIYHEVGKCDVEKDGAGNTEIHPTRRVKS